MSLCPLCRSEISVAETTAVFYDDFGNELSCELIARWCGEGCQEYSKVRQVE